MPVREISTESCIDAIDWFEDLIGQIATGNAQDAMRACRVQIKRLEDVRIAVAAEEAKSTARVLPFRIEPSTKDNEN